MKRKIFSLLTFALAFACMLCMAACDKKEPLSADDIEARVEKTEDALVVIKVETVKSDGVTLLQVMDYLQEEGELVFTIGADGMISSINGKANDTTNWTPFWYVYTSDAELSNKEWDVVNYNGTECGSALLGAESLAVTDGAYYVWQYK